MNRIAFAAVLISVGWSSPAVAFESGKALKPASSAHRAAAGKIEQLGGKVLRTQAETGEIYTTVRCNGAAVLVKKIKPWLADLDNLREFWIWSPPAPLNEELKLLADIPRLRSLRFRYARFSAAGRKRLARFRHIECLSFDNCFFKAGELEFLRNMPQLLSLKFRNHVRLPPKTMEPLQQLTALEELLIGSYYVARNSLPHLKNLRRLRKLTFEGSADEQTFVQLIDDGVFDRLREFTAYTWKLSDPFLKRLPRWTNLKTARLRIEGETASLASLEKMRHLRHLYLSVHGKTDLKSVASIGKATTLRSLAVHYYLNGKRLGEPVLPYCSELKDLERLTIATGPIQGKDLKPLARLPKLKEVHLDGLMINNTALQHLATLPNLHRIQATGIDIRTTRAADWRQLKHVDEIGFVSHLSDPMLAMLANLPALKAVTFFPNKFRELSPALKKKLKGVTVTMYE